MNRRLFLRRSLVGSALVASGDLASRLFAQPATDPYRGLAMGVTSYSFRKFDLDHAIAMTRELGLRCISLKSVHLPMDATAEQFRAAREKIAAAGLTLMGGGVIYTQNDRAEIQAAFEYAKHAGMPTIVAAPDPASMDIVEEMAKRHDIRVAIHNHGPAQKRWVSPRDAFEAVKSRDARLGLCIDIGHTVRNDEDPVAALREFSRRLYDVHIKDVVRVGGKVEDRIVGQGSIDIPGVFRALLDIKFGGHVEMEYELTPDDPLPGMTASLAYIRSVLAKLA